METRLPKQIGRWIRTAGALGLLGACTPHEPAGAAADHAATAAPNAKQAPAAAASTAAPASTPPHVAVERAAAESAAAQQGAGARSLTRVTDTSAVCMVNNTYMGKPQIPVQVEGRTYFGCCEMCKTRLERDPSARFATDPVSGRPVDKTVAVIGRDAANHVLYFENEQNYQKYDGN
jgi:YHS domain-containing protein